MRSGLRVLRGRRPTVDLPERSARVHLERELRLHPVREHDVRLLGSGGSACSYDGDAGTFTVTCINP